MKSAVETGKPVDKIHCHNMPTVIGFPWHFHSIVNSVHIQYRDMMALRA